MHSSLYGINYSHIGKVVPIKVRAGIGPDGNTILTWKPSFKKQKVNFLAHRSFFSGWHHAKITDTPIESNSFVDPTRTLGGYRYYIVQAIDSEGRTVGISED